MKKNIIYIILLIILLNSKTYAANLNLSGHSYLLMEEQSGRVLAEQNSHVKMPMASTTKIMTAMLALEYGNLDDNVIINDKSTNIEGSSIYLINGEEISLSDLLYGLMLRSGNDSALAIANHISGSEEAFIELMNKNARLLGASNTNFTNPHGLSDTNHFTTAYDLALITRRAFNNPEFEKISKSKTYKGEREGFNYFVNKNKTLWEYEGGDGVKIGYTLASGRCLVSSATRENMRLIAVSLKASDWFNDNYKLMDYGFENYNLYTIYDEEQLITQVEVINGQKDKLPLVTQKEFLYPLSEEEMEKINLVIDLDKNITAPVEKGQNLGTVDVFLDGNLIRSDKLIAKYAIAKKTIIQRVIDKFGFNQK